MLEQNASGVAHHLGVECQCVQRNQGLGPFHALGNTGGALESAGKGLAAQAVDHGSHLLRQRLAGERHLGTDDFELALALGVVEPVVQAAALDRVIEFAGAVAGEDGHRLELRADGADLRHAHLVFTQVFEQKGLKRLVSAVHLVNQEHGARRRGLQGFKQGAADQVALLVDLALHALRLQLTTSATLRGAHVQQLRGVVPFVQGFALLQAVVALQADQGAAQGGGQRFGQLGFAHAGFAFKQQRALQLERQKHRRGQAPLGKIPGLAQGVYECVYG